MAQISDEKIIILKLIHEIIKFLDKNNELLYKIDNIKGFVESPSFFDDIRDIFLEKMNKIYTKIIL